MPEAPLAAIDRLQTSRIQYVSESASPPRLQMYPRSRNPAPLIRMHGVLDSFTLTGALPALRPSSWVCLRDHAIAAETASPP